MRTAIKAKTNMEWNGLLLNATDKLHMYKLLCAERWLTAAMEDTYNAKLTPGRRNILEEKRRGRSLNYDSLEDEDRIYTLRIQTYNQEGDPLPRLLAETDQAAYLAYKGRVFSWLHNYFQQSEDKLHLLPLLDDSQPLTSAPRTELRTRVPPRYLQLVLPRLDGYEVVVAEPMQVEGLESEMPDGFVVALQYYNGMLCADLSPVAQLTVAYGEQGEQLFSPLAAAAKVLDEVTHLLASLYLQGAVPGAIPQDARWRFKETLLPGVIALSHPNARLTEGSNTLFDVTKEILAADREYRMVRFSAYCPQNVASRHFVASFFAQSAPLRFEGTSVYINVASEDQLNVFLSMISSLRLLRARQGYRIAPVYSDSPMRESDLPPGDRFIMHISLDESDTPFVYTREEPLNTLIT